MKLCYHEGNNFGDALNPIIFKKFLPDFFNEDTSVIFLGIGSILGLKKGYSNTKKIIVFSSGYAKGASKTYGTPPEIDKRYDIICVRGPLTAKELNINQKKVLTDAALLLSRFDFKSQPEKKYKFSFMPHIGSEEKFNWKRLTEKIGINYISPAENPLSIIEKISKTEIMICEAMHGAIASDALRVPWIPIRCYHTINKFKWDDYCKSVNLKYEPNELSRIYSNSYFNKILQNKFNNKVFNYLIVFVYSIYKSIVLEFIIRKEFKNVLTFKSYLCQKSILNNKCDELLKKIDELKSKYGNSN